MGDLSHLDGHGWEDLLSQWHARYLAEGLADIRRQEPPVVSHRARRLRRVRAGLPDFAGTLADGRRVAIEAKRSGDGRNRVFELRKIEKAQGQALTRAMMSGALVYVALLHEGRPCLIPWPELAPRWAMVGLGGRIHLHHGDLAGWPEIDPVAGWLPLIDPIRIDEALDRSGSDR